MTSRDIAPKSFKESSEKVCSFFASAGFSRSVEPTQLYTVLTDLLENHPVEKYGEIGSHIGVSLSFGALTNKSMNMFCYDAPNSGWGGEAGTEHFLNLAIENFAKDRAIVSLGNSHSEEIKNKIAKNGPYDMFLIDGDHSYSGAREDFDAVYPHVKSGGIIVMDDLLWHTDQLNRLFDDLLFEFKIQKYEKFLDLSPFERENRIHFRGVGVIYKE